MFAIAVPLASGEAEIRTEAPAGVPRPGELEGTTVLVIDNEPAILEGMQALLANWHMPVVAALDGAQASAALAANPSIGIVVADYHLEREDGLALVRRLRQEAGRMIPAILITADRSRALQLRAAGQGVVHMRKPIRSAALRAALAHLLAQSPSHRWPAPPHPGQSATQQARSAP
jgi:CheY-like chemotaxis protein